MTPTDKQTIETVIEDGYFHNSTICLRTGWQMFRTQFRLFAWYSLMIPFAGSLLGLIGFGNVGVLLFYLLITPVLYAGLYLAADKIFRKEALSFADFFEARFQAVPLIVNNFLAMLITFLVISPIIMILQRAGFGEWYMDVMSTPATPPEPPPLTSTESTAFTLNLIPLVYLQVAFSWAFPLILFYQAGPWQSLELSRRLVTKRWRPQFMLLLSFFSFFVTVMLILSPLAALSPGLGNIASFGMFLLFPWAYCSLYAGFRMALPLEKEKEEEEVDYFGR